MRKGVKKYLNYIIIFIIFLGLQKIEMLFWVRDIVTFPKQQSNKATKQQSNKAK